jgi:hypothetical protein
MDKYLSTGSVIFLVMLLTVFPGSSLAKRPVQQDPPTVAIGLSASDTQYSMNRVDSLSECSPSYGGEVSITVSDMGYITVTALAELDGKKIYEGVFFIGETLSDCTCINPSQGYICGKWGFEQGYQSAGREQISFSRTFYVESAGTYTFYLYGQFRYGSYGNVETLYLKGNSMQALFTPGNRN